MSTAPPAAWNSRAALRRWLPLGLLVVGVALAYALGLTRYLTLAAFAENRAAIKELVDHHLMLALSVFALTYIVVVSLSLPGAALLSASGGLLFGWALGAPVSIIAATIGAIIVFLTVRTSLGALIAERAGPFVSRLSEGFARDAFSYLLFLRLVPAFPYFAVNAVAGLCRVPLKAFVAATIIGIIPGAFAFSYLGTGLDSVLAAEDEAYRACVASSAQQNCAHHLSLATLVTPQLLA